MLPPLSPIASAAFASLILCLPSSPSSPQAGGKFPEPAPRVLDARDVKSLAARSIGPAVMGGRVSDLAFDPVDPATYYVAFGRGGLLKTTDDGGTFSGLLDDQAVSSMGAIALSPVDRKLLWAGSGEPNDRNSSGWGDGVYRSSDAGATWRHVGLAASKAIARIVAHPSDAKVAYVAAIGDLWNDGGERGLYKTSDGGESWKLVLAAPAPHDARVGCGDVAIDPRAPDTIYATLYARKRTAWSFAWGPEHSGGQDVGGIFRSVDGGATWTKLANGLPNATGRIGLAVAPSTPRTVYAIVQSADGGTVGIDEVREKSGGVFRSVDGGATWERRSPLNPRPFYFSQIRVAPDDPERIYVLGFALHVSEDGGATWREDRFGKVHPDCHALAIDPRHPARLLLGTDGGVYQSWDHGERWRHLATAAMGEFYRITLDDSEPYRIAGGLQDNLNWLGPSRTRSKEGIVHADWINLQGGDGFYCVFDPEDRNVVFAESQEGALHRFNVASGALKELRPEPAEGQPRLRFHWNSPLIGSRHARGTMYLAGNRVFELTARGERWRAISGDLSTGDASKTTAVGSGAENHGVVYALCESPLKAGMLWAGTDDGKLWLTDDGGERWSDLTDALPSAARGQWINRIEASHHGANVAYLAVAAFRDGNYAPLLYRTEDRGRTWIDLAAGLRGDAPVRVVREDPHCADLLFVGTEFELCASVDRGASWFEFGELPTVAIDDLQIHARDRDLVIATHGRSLWIVDDIRALEELTPDVRAAPAHLFEPRKALAYEPLPGWADWAGHAHFRGANPPFGATIDVWVREWTGDDVELSIKTAGGQPVAKLTAPGKPGIQRLTWDLRPSKDLLTEYGGEGSRFVRAGEYEVALTYGKISMTRKLVVDVAPDIETR